MIFRFEEFELDVAKREVRRAGLALKVEPQVFTLLELLVRRHGEVISKSEINTEIWNGREVSDGALSSRIRSARLVLDDNGSDQRLIKTIPHKGFVFVGKVSSAHEVSDTNVETVADPREAFYGPAPVPVNHARDESALTRLLANKSFGSLLAIAMIASFFVGISLLNKPAGKLIARSAPAKLVRADNTAIADNSIAVLSFEDMSAAHDQQYFADGVAEEILNYLAAHEGLKVASRTSAFSFRNKDTHITEIGKALGVRYIIEGSVRRVGNSMRVTAQFIDANTDEHIWSKTYDHKILESKTFVIQELLASTIVGEIVDHLNLKPVFLAENNTSLSAKEAFLRGNALRYSHTAETIDKAISEYNKSITLDPGFAPAYAALALTHAMTVRYQNKPLADVARTMRLNINYANAISPDIPEIHVAAVALSMLEQNYQDAISYANQALALRPNYAEAFKLKGDALVKLGRYDQAGIAYNEALERDPLSPDVLNALAEARIYARDLDGALEAALANLHWNPDTASALDMSSFLLWNQGNYTRSHEILKQAQVLTPDDIYVVSDLIYMYLDVGMNTEALNAARSDYDKAFYYAIDGNHTLAKQHFANQPNVIENDEVAYLLRDYKTAARLMKSVIDAENLLDEKPVRITDGDWMAKVCFVFTQVNDPYKDKTCDKLANFYDGKSPDDFLMIEDIFGGAAWQMMNSDPDQALIWIDALINRKLAFLKLTSQPVFSPLDTHPGFAARMAKNEENARMHRTALRASLN